MYIRHVSEEDLSQAMGELNKIFNDNIGLDDVEQTNKSRGGGLTYKLRLGVKDSKEAGSRRSMSMFKNDGSPYRIKKPCWHVHGVFFDLLLDINPKAVIVTTFYGRKEIYKNREGETVGNWDNWEVGSYFQRSTIADQCECGYNMEAIA